MWHLKPICFNYSINCLKKSLNSWGNTEYPSLECVKHYPTPRKKLTSHISYCRLIACSHTNNLLLCCHNLENLGFLILFLLSFYNHFINGLRKVLTFFLSSYSCHSLVFFSLLRFRLWLDLIAPYPPPPTPPHPHHTFYTNLPYIHCHLNYLFIQLHIHFITCWPKSNPFHYKFI